MTPSNNSFKSDNNFTLDDSIVFKDFSDNILVLDKTPTLVITGDDNWWHFPKENKYFIQRKRYTFIP